MVSLNKFFTRQPEPLIGVDISATAIKLVELSRDSRGGWTLERCAMESLGTGREEDDALAYFDEVVAALRRLLKKSGTRAKHVALSLPPSAVITKKVVLPGNLSDQELEIQVESEASQYIPFSLDEVSLDFCVIGPSPKSPGDMDVLLAATRKEKLQERVEIVEAAGLKPVVMDIDTYAARLAVERLQEGPQAALHVGEADLLALIKIGGRGYNMQVLRGEEVLYDTEQSLAGSQLTQTIARHYSMSIEEAEQKKRAGDLPADYPTEVLQPFVKGLAQDIARSLQFFFTSTPYHSVQKVLLFGGSASLDGLASAIEDSTKVSTKVLNPFEGMDLGAGASKSRVRRDAPSYLTACGLALRRFYQ